MKLFYTSAEFFGAPQDSPFISLGGYVSGTQIANGLIGNVFSDLSNWSRELGVSEIRAIALINQLDTNVTNEIDLWIEYPHDGNPIVFPLGDTELNSLFSVAGIVGEQLSLTIPAGYPAGQFSLLYDQILAQKIGGGDLLVADLWDGSILASDVSLHVMESHMDGTDAVITFSPPDYDGLGLDFNTLEILVSPGLDYEFTNFNRTNDCNIEVAIVTLSNGQVMEAVNSPRALPYNATFYSPIGEGNRILIADGLDISDGLGIWIKRTPISPNPIDGIECSELEAYQSSLSKKEELKLVISY